MVFSICCLALSGGALAVDDVDGMISPFSLVSGSNDHWTSSDVLYDVGNAQVAPGTKPGLSLGPINTYGPSAQYNVFQFVSTGKKITGIHPGDIIAVNLGNVVQECTINKPGAESVLGSVSFNPYWGSVAGSTGNAGWIDGMHFSPTSWDCVIQQSDGAGSEKLHGTGGRCTLDASGLKGVFKISITWHFPVINKTVPSSFSGDTLFLNFRTITTVKASTSTSEAQTQEDILSGVNTGNDLQAETNGILYDVFDTLTSLPGKIADAIKGLFVPTDAQMEELKGSFNTLLSDKMGFVYQAGSLVDGVFDAIFDAVDNPDSDVSFTVPAFPSFNVAGTEVSLWEDPVVVDIADNEVVQTVQQVASPFVVAVMIWGFVHSMEEAFLAFVGGQTLASWVRNRKEDAD